MRRDITDKALHGVSRWDLQQMEGRETARKKIPSWAAVEGIWWPVRLSLQQCSSEACARHKASVIGSMQGEDTRRRFIDMTGGLGVDFSFIAPLFREAIYIEQDEELCRIARHNMPLLGLTNIRYINAKAENLQEDILSETDQCTTIMIDPARRDVMGRKMVGLHDCIPDVTEIVPRLRERGARIVLKLSPMLDITAAERELPGEWAEYAVALEGECKELLLVSGHTGRHAVDIIQGEVHDYCPKSDMENNETSWADSIEQYLYEPSAAVLKVQLQDTLPGKKLSQWSHLFTSAEPIDNFPGRAFRVEGQYSFSKASLRNLTKDITQANISVRGCPMKVDDLRKKLRLRDGGDTYLFAATMNDGSHVIIRCSKSKV